MLLALWVLLEWLSHVHLVNSFNLGREFQAHRSTTSIRNFDRNEFVPVVAQRPPYPFHMLCTGHRLRGARTVHRGDDTALFSAIRSQRVLIPAAIESSLSEAVVNKLFSSKDSLDSMNMTLLIAPNSTTEFTKHNYQESSTTCDSLAGILASQQHSATKETSIFAVLAGSGRGKTAFLCELTKALNRLENAVAVGISFNDHWDSCSWNALILNEVREKADKEAEALLGVAVRIWSMIANVPFIESVASFRSTIREVAANHSLSDVSELPLTFAQRLLGQLITSYVKLQRSEYGKPDVTRFILLVDEPAYGEGAYGVKATFRDGIVQTIGLQALIARTIVSARTTWDRNVPISELFPPSQGLSGGLVLSALSTKVLGESDSSHRTIVGIPVRGSLDARTVVEEWLPIYASEDWQNVYKKDSAAALKAELLISTIVEIPRAVTSVMETFSEGLSAVSPQNVAKLVGNMKGAISSRLDKIQGNALPVNIVQKLLSRESVELSAIMSLISNTLLTNSVTTIPKIGEEVNVTPVTGAWNLWTLAEDEIAHPFLLPAKWMFDGLMRHLEDLSNNSAAGTPLEIVSRQTINLRLKVMAAQTTEKRTLSLSDILCGYKVHGDAAQFFDDYLEPFSGLTFEPNGTSKVVLNDEILQPARSCLRNSADVDAYMEERKVKAYLNSKMIENEDVRKKRQSELRNEYRNDAIKAFLRKAQNNSLSDSHVVRQLRLHPKESADGAWMMRDAATGKVHVLLMDTKSHHIPSTIPTNALDTDDDGLSMQRLAWVVTDGWKQARHWQNVCAVAKQMVEKGEVVSNSSDTLFDALANGRYYYIYLEAGHRGETVVSTEEAVNAEPQHTLSLKDIRLSTLKERKRVVCDDANAVFLGTAAVEQMMGPFNSVYKVARKLSHASELEKQLFLARAEKKANNIKTRINK